MSKPTQTLWQVIETVGHQMPLTRDALEQVLATKLVLVEEDSNGRFWTGGNIELGNEVRIAEATLVIRHEPPHRVGSTLHLEGACVAREEVKSRYPDLRIVGHPRGHSLQEVTAYGSTQPWGDLTFAFREADPDCLAYVSFRIGYE